MALPCTVTCSSKGNRLISRKQRTRLSELRSTTLRKMKMWWTRFSQKTRRIQSARSETMSLTSTTSSRWSSSWFKERRRDSHIRVLEKWRSMALQLGQKDSRESASPSPSTKLVSSQSLRRTLTETMTRVANFKYKSASKTDRLRSYDRWRRSPRTNQWSKRRERSDI